MSRLSRELRAFLETHRDTVRLWWLAPLVPALAVLPEFAQHALEVRLGMFESAERFRQLAPDPTRLAIGSVKIVGLVLAIVLAARTWSNRADGKRWWSAASVGWKQVAVGFALQVVFAVPGFLARGLGPDLELATNLLVTALSLPPLMLLIAGLLGDRDASLRHLYLAGWGKALRIAAHVAPFWIAAQWMHEKNHWLALGAGEAEAWALMTWDALLVGVMATLAGTGFHHGYRGAPGDPEPPANTASGSAGTA